MFRPADERGSGPSGRAGGGRPTVAGPGPARKPNRSKLRNRRSDVARKRPPQYGTHVVGSPERSFAIKHFEIAFTEGQRISICADFQAGRSLKVLAKENGTNTATLSRRLRQWLGDGPYEACARYTNPGNRPKITASQDELLELYLGGLTLLGVARLYRCSVKAVRNRLEIHPRWDDPDVVAVRHANRARKDKAGRAIKTVV